MMIKFLVRKQPRGIHKNQRQNMRYLQSSLIICFLFTLSVARSQDNTESCQDVIHLKGGSVFRGKILEYTEGGEVVFTSWSGARMQFSSSNIKRIVQKCKEDKAAFVPIWKQPYAFNETGWYSTARIYALPGASGLGLGLQFSSGLKLNRLLSMGLGFGMENFNPGNNSPTTFPLFAVLRGYFMENNVSPFYSVGMGYGFSKETAGNVDEWPNVSSWKGGWMAQGGLGYRIGNHFTCQIGIRFQHRTRSWESLAWGNLNGKDNILHKRFDVGLGILF